MTTITSDTVNDSGGAGSVVIVRPRCANALLITGRPTPRSCLRRFRFVAFARFGTPRLCAGSLAASLLRVPLPDRRCVCGLYRLVHRRAKCTVRVTAGDHDGGGMLLLAAPDLRGMPFVEVSSRSLAVISEDRDGHERTLRWR